MGGCVRPSKQRSGAGKRRRSDRTPCRYLIDLFCRIGRPSAVVFELGPALLQLLQLLRLAAWPADGRTDRQREGHRYTDTASGGTPSCKKDSRGHQIAELLRRIDRQAAGQACCSSVHATAVLRQSRAVKPQPSKVATATGSSDHDMRHCTV